MKWAADWWGIEIIAETPIDACDLEIFIFDLKKEAVVSYGTHGANDKNEIEVGERSKILGASFPLVVTFNREC
jgi:hypothetical protein